jgi:hypothetical protein
VKQLDYDPPEDEKRLVFEFDPPLFAKQLWIVGNEVPLVDCWGYCFSLADVEVIDTHGRNIASAAYGTGVTVSSTEYGYDDDRVTTSDLWATAWDLGLKWVRVSAWTSSLMWSYVERARKGEYYIDPVTDQAVTDLSENGVNVILGLAYGNYLYDRPREWEKEQTDILELPMPPFEGESREAFLRWTRFMANHFKDRVQFYYIWNEPYQAPPYGWGDSVKFSAFVRDLVRVIKEEYPDAKISWPTARTSGEFLEGCFKQGIAPLFDMVHADLSDPPGIKQRWRDAGFAGDHWITYEWSSLATYPTPSKEAPYTAPDQVVSEIEKAKNVARSASHQASHRIIMSICEWFNTYHPIWDVGLFRNTFSADPVSPTQPQPAYYVLRNMATILAECEPSDFAYYIEGTTRSPQLVRFERQGGNKLLALWFVSDRPPKYRDVETGSGFVLSIGKEISEDVEQVQPEQVDLLFPDQRVKSVTAIDTLNGVQQALIFENTAAGAWVRGLQVHDYPLYLEFEPQE